MKNFRKCDTNKRKRHLLGVHVRQEINKQKFYSNYNKKNRVSIFARAFTYIKEKASNFIKKFHSGGGSKLSAEEIKPVKTFHKNVNLGMSASLPNNTRQSMPIGRSRGDR